MSEILQQKNIDIFEYSSSKSPVNNSSYYNSSAISGYAQVSTLAAKTVGIQTGPNGEPIIKTGSEYQSFQNALKTYSSMANVN